MIWRTIDGNGKKVIIPEFVFTDGSEGLLKGYSRGLGPIGDDLKDYEDPIGIYMDDGTYYAIHVDLRDASKRDSPTFKIGKYDFYHPITKFKTMMNKVDPKTGNLITEKKLQKGEYQIMIDESEALNHSLERSEILNPLHSLAQMNSYKALGAKVRDASISIRAKVSLDSRNLTDKGKFLKFITEMEKRSIQNGWKRDWQWYTVKDYYEDEMKKRDQRFLSDITKPRRKENQFKYIQRVSNIKKMISDFSFAEFMKMTYFMLNNPEDAYSFGYFNREFKLSKMVQKDRLDGIYGIMNKASYWNDKEIFIKTIEELTESKEYKEELRMQAIARLSDEEVQELNTLKKEVEHLEKESLKVLEQISKKENRYYLLLKYYRSYQNHLRDGKSEQKAIQYTTEDYQNESELPELKDTPNLTNVLKEEIDLLESKLTLTDKALEVKMSRVKKLELY